MGFIVGREKERDLVLACLRAGRNVLIEGPVGCGKTTLALAVAAELKRPVFRIDGDSRLIEQKLAGGFDPASVVAKGYQKESFVPGPLFEAFEAGGVLLLNELNRLPESAQNLLLPAVDEGLLYVPRLGSFQAKAGFCVIGTQNPREFVATSQLSEALLDRFELVRMDYPARVEEIKIVEQSASLQRTLSDAAKRTQLAERAVDLVRATRGHPRFKRGGSIRAAQSLAEIAAVLWSEKGETLENALIIASEVALANRVETATDIGAEIEGRAPNELSEFLRENLKKDALQKEDHKKKV